SSALDGSSIDVPSVLASQFLSSFLTSGKFAWLGSGDTGSLFKIASRRRMSFSRSHLASSIPDLYEVSESSALIFA
ncbi:hypothetical protein Tco_0562866, partial [Tanacetum coccineum]